jgi:predicted transposase YbfD/YdcC
MIVKGNQPALLNDIQDLFRRAGNPNVELTPVESLRTQHVRAVGDAAKTLPMRNGKTHEVGHGRIEERSIQVITVPHGKNPLDWPAAEQVFQLQRSTRIKNTGKLRNDTVYGVTNMTEEQATPEALLKLCRGHWTIENRSHWVRDVTFDEDRSSVRSRSIPQLMAALRNITIALMRVTGHTNIAAACRTNAAKPHRVLAFIRERLTFE